MKKAFFTAMLVMSIIGLGALTASAQTWSWEISTPISPNVQEIAANPVYGEVYGIDETGTPVVLSPTYTTSGVTQIPEDPYPVVDLVVGSEGIVYAISDTAVSTWDPILDEYALLESQPIIPEGSVGKYQHIAYGMDGELYVLFETDESEPVQYLLKGNPPYFTEGVEVGFYPRTLNLRSNGNYVHCRIMLPSDFDEADIDPDSLMITKIEVAGVGSAEGLIILRAPNSPHGVSPFNGSYNLKFYRSYKNLTDLTQSFNWQLEQLLVGQEKGKYDVTLTLEGSLNGYPRKFQGQSSFDALVTRKIN